MSKQTQTPYRSMTAEQRVKYNAEFMKWYANRSQIIDCVAQQHALDADANRAFDEGVRLLQAWPFGVKFLDSVSCLPKVKCVDRLMYLTDLAKKQMQTLTPSPLPSKGRGSSQQQTMKENRSQSKQSENEKVSEKKENSIPLPSTLREENTPVIPESGKLHLDQISYLLSPSIAERVKNLKQILDIRDAESNIAKQLAADGKSQQEIAPHSEAAVKAQEEATAIYERVDDELADIVGMFRYVRTHKPEPGVQEEAFNTTIHNLEEAARPFGTLDRLIAALTPYYEKCNKDGRIDRSLEQDFKFYENKVSASNEHHDDATAEPAYDQKDYKRIWTYVSRQDVAHTEKRLKKMRECIDEAIAAGMPNIEAMETFYAKEAELVLAEQEKRLNDGQPSLL